MASWILVPCLDRLRDDFNEVAPGRDRASDGTIADQNHESTSDHTPDEISDALRRKDGDSRNEVHALDVDADLRVPGLSMEIVVQHLLSRCRSGAEKRLRYIIFNRRIWSASDGWRQEKYTGPNAHDKHAHFSSSYDTAREASTASWHLEDIPVALTADDKKWISAEIAKQVKAAQPDLPAATDIADAVFARARNSPFSMLSDTATNLTEARVTEAVRDGKVIERFPFNEGK
jgi:hypothetical protein